MTSTKTVLILGGYGNTGRRIAVHLLKATSNVNIIIAGRNLEKASKLAEELGSRATARLCDASKPDLAEKLKDVDLLVVASNTVEYVDNVVRAALDAKVDYFDIQMSTKHKIEYLNSKKQDIAASKLCFVTDGGFHPGLPAVIIRFVAMTSTKDIVSAKGYCNISMDFKNIQNNDTLYEEFLNDLRTMEMRVYGGDPPKWTDFSWLKPPEGFDFGPPVGIKQCAPLFLEELNEVTRIMPSIQELGFYMAGFNWFTDFVVFPLAFIALTVFGKYALRPMSKLLFFSLQTFSKPPYGTKISFITKHCIENNVDTTHIPSDNKIRPMTLSHVDGYEMTAIPAVGCILQMLDNRQTGLFLQGIFVEPLRMIDDMKRMGIEISYG